MREKVFPAAVENLPEVTGFVEEMLEDCGCPVKILMQTVVCVEEMFVNVANYAYGDKTGDVLFRIDTDDSTITITLTDSGIPFNPLERKDPDTTLSADDRQIGGLGIYIVKKSMDAVCYERKENKNVFTMKKNFGRGN